MPELSVISRASFEAVLTRSPDDESLALLADMARHNALVAVKRAGSGHLGSSLSSLDIVVALLFRELDVRDFADPERDVFFSSKGHDVPGLYAVLHALGVIPTDRLMSLRRLGGLDGHPDVDVPGIEANSGSLGMGISKGRGIALAKRLLRRGGRVVVMTGDGELQEGQNWEGLQAAAHDRIDTLWVIVDRNELQSDRPTEEILALGDLEAKLAAFGWDVRSCDGHDHAALNEAFSGFEAARDGRPKILVANTVKGAGVSFMEHPRALADGNGTYRWHAGAPDDDAFEAARAELLARIAERGEHLGVPPVDLEAVRAPVGETVTSLEGEPESGAGAPQRVRAVTDEYVAAAYGEALLELAREHPELVVLDADLASDCRVRAVELEVPERFVEVGIAEQDMVSAAAGMARHGLLPVVNSFASFLASRANEQIYNQASERSKVIYALHYAGLIPAGPGKSHQSLRDVSLLAAIPGIAVVHPGNAEETQAVLRWAVEEAEETVAIRLAIGPSPRRLELGGDWQLRVGRGTTLSEGDAALVLAYGPVMLHESLLAAEHLRARGVRIEVVDLPWLNRIDPDWLREAVAEHSTIVVVEDHAPVGALGDAVRRLLGAQGLDYDRTLEVFGVEGWPACGTPPEALRAHGLDGFSLARRVEELIGARTGS